MDSILRRILHIHSIYISFNMSTDLIYLSTKINIHLHQKMQNHQQNPHYHPQKALNSPQNPHSHSLKPPFLPPKPPSSLSNCSILPPSHPPPTLTPNPSHCNPPNPAQGLFLHNISMHKS
ncbi:unnamed protein product [Moneuplotes crassus]|uniref:Uncharacterized protein n=1 Tax=Euplotes crassus TaxID=5936 RepID=A0AAD1XZ84_EUPCR|nr:unnamed protein product [Moneuplotes crassus]